MSKQRSGGGAEPALAGTAQTSCRECIVPLEHGIGLTGALLELQQRASARGAKRRSQHQTFLCARERRCAALL